MSGKNNHPLVTIGIVSYNRLLYLRTLMASARACIKYPNIEWIIIDGNSVEPGLKEFIESLDDVQFIVNGEWMSDLVELVAENRSIGHIGFDAQRRLTLSHFFGNASVDVFGRQIHIPFIRRSYKVYKTRSGRKFLGYGKTRIGITPAGIMSFGRTSIWRDIGPWCMTKAHGDVSNDSSLGAEEYMVQRYKKLGLNLELVLMQVPVIAEIITDQRGTKAKIRGGNRRYGRYMAPPSGDIYYYRIWMDGEVIPPDPRQAVWFENIVKPIGYNLPVDENGGLLKACVITDDEPYELLDTGKS